MTTIDGQEIDATLSFAVSHEVETTDHPIETGSDPTDHIRAKPLTIQMEGLHTATPLGAPVDMLRPRALYDRLVALQKGKRVITVTNSDFGDFPDMVLISLSPPRDASTGDALRFSATFKQISTVASLVVETPSEVNLLKKKVGKQPPKPAPTADGEDARTRAAALFDLIRGN